MKRKGDESGAEVDVDHDFLDQVLNKLYDFGEDGHGKRSKKKHNRKGEGERNENIGHVKAGLSRVSVAAALCTESPAPKQANVEVVTFLDPLKKNKLKRAAKPEAEVTEVKDNMKNNPDEPLSIEKARLEVHRFGITGFQKQQQRVFEQDRAVMLGAWPPKKEYVNYRVYQKTLKEKKMMEKEAMSDTQKKKRSSSGKRRSEKLKAAPSGREPTGLMGRFKNGVLVLKSRDIRKVNSKRGRK